MIRGGREGYDRLQTLVRARPTASRATFHGRRRASGVTMIPSRTRCVRTAIPATAIHGSVAGSDGSSSRAM